MKTLIKEGCLDVKIEIKSKLHINTCTQKDDKGFFFYQTGKLCEVLNEYVFNLFAICPSQQFFSHDRTFPSLNQYQAEDKKSCLRTQHSASGEARTSHLKSSSLPTSHQAHLVYNTSLLILAVKVNSTMIPTFPGTNHV